VNSEDGVLALQGLAFITLGFVTNMVAVLLLPNK
jgi:hypothetical protein